uniref:Uncharacterized protein n=1 Tax=Cucumis melo TaxID=3656 RepID=A0A9I9ELP7_CUCME
MDPGFANDIIAALCFLFQYIYDFISATDPPPNSSNSLVYHHSKVKHQPFQSENRRLFRSYGRIQFE